MKPWDAVKTYEKTHPVNSKMKIKELSYRLKRCIHYARIEMNKKAVKKAILTGKLSCYGENKNAGKKSFDELCKWIGYEPPTPIICPTCGQTVYRRTIPSKKLKEEEFQCLRNK